MPPTSWRPRRLASPSSPLSDRRIVVSSDLMAIRVRERVSGLEGVFVLVRCGPPAQSFSAVSPPTLRGRCREQRQCDHGLVWTSCEYCRNRVTSSYCDVQDYILCLHVSIYDDCVVVVYRSPLALLHLCLRLYICQ